MWRIKKFADDKRARIENRLGVVVDAAQAAFDEFEESRIRRERKEEVRQQQRKVAIERAVVLHREGERFAILNGEIESWRRAEKMREYAGLLDGRFGDGAAEWTEWIRVKADEIDPLNAEPHGVPNIPAAKPNDLLGYLPQGVSPWL